MPSRSIVCDSLESIGYFSISRNCTVGIGTGHFGIVDQRTETPIEGE